MQQNTKKQAYNCKADDNKCLSIYILFQVLRVSVQYVYRARLAN